MADDTFDSAELITNLPSRRRDMPLDDTGVPVARVGKARGQEHEFFDTIGMSGRLELVKCQFCGLERTRISFRMRDHLARKCPGGVPPDLRQTFLKSLGPFNRSSATTVSQNGVKRKMANNVKMSTDVSGGKDERMIREEHELRMKKMKIQIELAEEQKKVLTVVGSEFVRVMQTFDAWLRTGSVGAARVTSFIPNAFPHQQPPNTHF